MKAIITKAVNYGGRIFEAGENVRGRIPADFLAILQEQGVLEEVSGETVENLAETDAPLSLTQLKEKLHEVTDPETVEAMLQKEQGSEKPRSGAVDLLEKRLKELKENSQALGDL